MFSKSGKCDNSLAIFATGAEYPAGSPIEDIEMDGYSGCKIEGLD